MHDFLANPEPEKKDYLQEPTPADSKEPELLFADPTYEVPSQWNEIELQREKEQEEHNRQMRELEEMQRQQNEEKELEELRQQEEYQKQMQFDQERREQEEREYQERLNDELWR